MRIEELRKAIRGLVRTEVRKAVAEEVSKAMGKVLVEMVKEIKANDSSKNKEIVEESTENTPPIYTKSPKLNSVLAETARGYKPLPKIENESTNLASLMGGDFEKIGQGEEAVTKVDNQGPTTKLDFLKQMVGASGPAIMNQPSALDGGTEVPDMLKKVFKKDFRAIMRRIDEQKKGLSPGGYIDPSKVIAG
jgi:hypothetical protein